MATRKKPTQSASIGAVRSIRAKHYINSAVKSFSLADCIRSIPGVDGLKPSQRKALYGALLRGENAGELQLERLCSQFAACVTGDTLVTMGDGTQVRIDNLVDRFNNGEALYVKSLNLDNNTIDISEVSNVFLSKLVEELVVINTEDGEVLTLTPDHKVYTSNRGWVVAGELTSDDILVQVD